MIEKIIGLILCLILLIFLIKVLFIISSGSLLPITKGALFVPTSRIAINTLLNSIKIKEDDKFVDLGCGDGRVILSVYKRCGAKVVGYEINPFAYLIARIKGIGKKNIKIKWKNFWNQNLGDADIVFCYLFPDLMKELREKLKKELKLGARVISFIFPIPEWRPHQEINVSHSEKKDKIYIYSIPNAWKKPHK